MAAALLLSGDGHRVTVFEQFDAPRPIGSGLMLQVTGLAALQQLGLAEKAITGGQRIDRLWGEAKGRVVLDVRYGALKRRNAFGVGIHRADLFTLLHERLEPAGIRTATGHEVIGCETANGGGRLMFANGGAEGPFDLIVDALGNRSRLAPAAGCDLSYGALWTNVDLPPSFDPHALSQRYRRASVMAGVLPIGTPAGAASPQAAFFWSLRAEQYPGWRSGGLDRWKKDVLDLWPATEPLLDQINSPDALTFARYAHKTLRRPVEPRLIHIGDAWHSASPQLGQGANMALLDAYALAAGLRRGSDLDEGLSIALAMRRFHVGLYQALTYLLTPVYQSDSKWIPVVRDRLMGPFSKLWPMTSVQAALVSGLVGSPLKRLGIDFAPSRQGR